MSLHELIAVVLLMHITCAGSEVRADEPEPAASSFHDFNLGDSSSELSLRIFGDPVFYGDRLVVLVTVRNASDKPKSLPLPEALPVQMFRADYSGTLFPDDAPVPFARAVTRRGHQHGGYGAPAHRGNPRPGDVRCLSSLASRSVIYKPGESRTGTWVSQVLLSSDMFGYELTAGYGVLISTHGLLPERWFRVLPRKLGEPIRGQLVRMKDGTTTFFWLDRLAHDSYVLFAMGAWRPWEEPPSPFNAATLNSMAGGYGLLRYGVLRGIPSQMEGGPEDTVIVDGREYAPAMAYSPLDHPFHKPSWLTPRSEAVSK